MGIDTAGRNIMGWTTGHPQRTANLSQPRRYPDLEQQLLCEQYRVVPEAFWHPAHVRGEDRYDHIKAAQRHGWLAVSSWGSEGWDLGAWPLVVILHRRTAHGFELAYNVEGDITVYRYPTRELRNAATDCLALWHWKHDGRDWVDGVESVDTAPEQLRGPFSGKRLATSTLRQNGI
jgi:hypothetical protein